MKLHDLLGIGVALALACGGKNVDDGDGSGSSTSGDSSGESGGSESADGTGDGTGDGTDGGGPECDGQTCASDEFCDWGVNTCGAEYDEGTCTERPQEGCAEIYEPVCGCDGAVYGNGCEAQQGGVDVNENGGCEPPGGLFACGWRFCDPNSSYCQVGYSDVGGEPNSYNCLPLPDGCGDAPSCDCLADEPCADFNCEGDENGLQLECPGG
jgi:hypothetical protein